MYRRAQCLTRKLACLGISGAVCPISGPSSAPIRARKCSGISSLQLVPTRNTTFDFGVNLSLKLKACYLHSHPFSFSSKMFGRALRPARALPLRSNVSVPLSRRAVTTDAASSHAEKENVPEVGSLTSNQEPGAYYLSGG